MASKTKSNLINIASNTNGLKPVAIKDEHKAKVQQAFIITQGKQFELEHAQLNLKSVVQEVALELGLNPKEYDLTKLNQNEDGSVVFLPIK